MVSSQRFDARQPWITMIEEFLRDYVVEAQLFAPGGDTLRGRDPWQRDPAAVDDVPYLTLGRVTRGAAEGEIVVSFVHTPYAPEGDAEMRKIGEDALVALLLRYPQLRQFTLTLRVRPP